MDAAFEMEVLENWYRAATRGRRNYFRRAHLRAVKLAVAEVIQGMPNPAPFTTWKEANRDALIAMLLLNHGAYTNPEYTPTRSPRLD